MKHFFGLSVILLLAPAFCISSYELPDIDDNFLKELEKSSVTSPAPASLASYELVSPSCACAEDVDLELEIPYFGTIVFRSVKTIDGKEGVEGVVIFPKDPIIIGPLTIHNKGVFTFTGGQIKFTGKATLDLGYKKFEAIIGLRELIFAGTQKQKDDPKTGVRKVMRIVDRCVFGIEVTGSGSELELIPGLPLSIKSLDLVIVHDKSPAITLNGFVGKAPAAISTVLDLKKKTLRLEGSQTECKLTDIAPFLQKTLLADFSFDGSWYVTTGGTAHFEGRLYGKTPQDKALIEPFPGVSASFDRIVFDYKSDKSAVVTIKTTLLGMPIDYVGTYDVKTTELALKAVLKQVKLTDLLPVFLGTDFKNIVFDGTALLSTEKGFVVNGGLHDTGYAVPLYGLALRKVAINLDTKKQAGGITGVADLLGLPVSATFVLGWGKQVDVVLSAGIAEGTTSWQPFILIPKGPEELEFLRTITIDNPTLRLSLGLGAGKPEKYEEKQGVKKDAKKDAEQQAEKKEAIYLTLDELRKKGTHANITVAGTVRAGKLLADAVTQVGKVAKLPQEVIGLIQPKDITLEALFKLGLSQAQTINAVGFLNLPDGFTLTDILPAEDAFKKSLGKDAGVVLYQVLNLVRMDSGKLVVCLSDEEIDGVKYTTGLSINTNISIADKVQKIVFEKLSFLKGIFEKKGERGAGFRFLLNFDPFNLKNFLMEIGLTTGDITVTIPKLVRPAAPAAPVINIGPYDFSQLTLDCVVRGDGVGVACGFNFTPHEHKDQKPIYCSGELKATATAIGGDFSTDGKALWLNPFGIEKFFRGGFGIGKLGFRISESYESLAAIPETFGLSLLAVGTIGASGEVVLGKTKPLSLSVFFKLGLDLTDFAFEASGKNLGTIFDLLQGFAEALGIADDRLQQSLARLGAIGDIEEASIKITPFGGNIDDVKVTAGVGGALVGKLLGMPFGAKLLIDLTGIYLHGYLPDIKIGPLVITRAPAEELKKRKIADPQELKDAVQKYLADRTPIKVGPEVELVLSLKELPRFRINGDVRFDLPGGEHLLRAFTDIEISKDRLAFTIKDQIGPDWAGLKAEITASTINMTGLLPLLISIQPKNLGLEIVFTNTLSDTILGAIRHFNAGDTKVAGLIPRLLPLAEKIVKFINVKRIYWKGTLDDLSRGRIPGVIIDVDINGKEYRGNLGDIDFTSKGDFDSSVAQIGINLLRMAGSIVQDLLGIDFFIPPCAPSVLIEFQNQWNGFNVIVVNKEENLKSEITWWHTPKYRGYEVVDTLCQHKPERIEQQKRPPGWLGIEPPSGVARDTIKNYIVNINQKAVLEVQCSYSALRPDGTETIKAEVYKLEPDGTKMSVGTQENYGERVVDVAFPGLPPFVFKTIIAREFNQAKIKFYIQEQACSPNAWVEVINQQKVKLVVRDLDTNIECDVPNWDVTAWTPLPLLCRPKSGTLEKHYLLIVDGIKLAVVKCLLFADGKMSAHIRTPDNQRCLRDSKGTSQNIKYNFGNYTVGAEAFEQLTGLAYQSKFKIYLQDKNWQNQGPECAAGPPVPAPLPVKEPDKKPEPVPVPVPAPMPVPQQDRNLCLRLKFEKIAMLKPGEIDKLDEKTGQSLLSQAAQAGCYAEVRTLIEKGANVNLPDRDGKTPLWHAEHAPKTAYADNIITALKAKGARSAG